MAWLMENYGDLAALLLALLGVGEIVVRLTPTQKDDGMMERIGSFVRKVLDLLKMPNLKK